MGPDHTDDSGGWDTTSLHRKLTDELEEARARVGRLTMVLAHNHPDLVDARVELRLREEIAAASARQQTGPLPLELLHAMHCVGRSSVWVPLDDGHEVLAHVIGSVRRDTPAERAVYRQLLGMLGIPAPTAVCGYWVQPMTARLLGYAHPCGNRKIVISTKLTREERRQVRSSLATALKTRSRTIRPRMLGMLAPLPLLVASVRAVLRGSRDIATGSSLAGSALAQVAAVSLVTAVAVVPMTPTVLPHFDAGPPRVRQAGPVNVAENAPLTATPRVSKSPRPKPAAASSEPQEPITSPLASPEPVVPTPVPVPVPVDSSPAPVDPTPVPGPEPSVIETPTTPPVQPPPEPVPSELEVRDVPTPPSVTPEPIPHPRNPALSRSSRGTTSFRTR